jgi:hypothetical protein
VILLYSYSVLILCTHTLYSYSTVLILYTILYSTVLILYSLDRQISAQNAKLEAGTAARQQVR